MKPGEEAKTGQITEIAKLINQSWENLMAALGLVESEYGPDAVITLRVHRCLKEIDSLLEEVKFYKRVQARRWKHGREK